MLDANRTVSFDRLVEDLWGQEAPESAVKMVQIYVSQLRKRLPDELLRTRAPGYLADLTGHSLDLRRFEDGERTGRAAKMEQATAVGGGVLVVAGAGAEEGAEFIEAAAESLGRGEALEAAHASRAPFHDAVVLLDSPNANDKTGSARLNGRWA